MVIFSTLGRTPQAPGPRASISSAWTGARGSCGKGAHRTSRSPVVPLELVDGVEKAPVRMGAEKRRIRRGVHRAHLPQLPREPVHAEEIDALGPGACGVRPNVEKITIRRPLRATREAEETDRRCGQEVAARWVARMGHLGALRH